ncbi:hypothetical protein Vadar_015578 [Vaccinium darrowii]|uniref:Uncharacterized protein n=1 Tax=Vaccinium darrowii TaxID=229202 RepID=A0ACB7YMI3_9ERIC|nr:hypothetical protein Vadar_015578 [Vaccinium darrowii]
MPSDQVVMNDVIKSYAEVGDSPMVSEGGMRDSKSLHKGKQVRVGFTVEGSNQFATLPLISEQKVVGVANVADKAQVIQHFAETVSGSPTIRSFDQESLFKELIMKLIDVYSQPNFYNDGAMEWLCFRLDILSSITFAFFWYS